jgi:hypothetical protein
MESARAKSSRTQLLPHGARVHAARREGDRAGRAVASRARLPA